MTIDKVHTDLQFIIRKANGKWYAPEELDEVLHSGQLSVFRTYREMGNKNQPVHMALNPFKVNYTFSPPDFIGAVMTKPTGYEYATGIMVRNYDNKYKKAFTEDVTLYTENEWEFAKNSQVSPASSDKPIALESQGIEFYPQASYNGTLRYLRLPNRPKYDYVLNGRDPVYQPSTSIDLEWSDLYVREIILKALSIIGINLGAQDILNYAEQKTNQNIATANKE